MFGTSWLQIDPETQELVYEFEVKYNGVRAEESVILVRVMLLHPYRTFSIEDKLNISTGTKVRLCLRKGMMITRLSPSESWQKSASDILVTVFLL